MMTLFTTLRSLLYAICAVLSISCSAKNANPKTELAGSTPGDESIKSMLSIPQDTKIDFIRWDMILSSDKTFHLELKYGESQPNTLSFKSGGQSKEIEGTYLISTLPENGKFREIYKLNSNGFSRSMSLAKLSGNIFHILTTENKLMVGNGGWSYSLNKKVPDNTEEILIKSSAASGLSKQIFDGRTPCQEIVAAHPKMKASSSCFKIKWRLILYRDSLTRKPKSCTIRNIVDNQPRDITGQWEIINGTDSNPDAIIYKVTVDNLADPILFLAGDENVLFFLNKNFEPLAGNKDFSFTMNRSIN